MRVIISFKLDDITLESGIRWCLYQGIKPNKKNVKTAIISNIKTGGSNLITFPEYWGDNVQMYDYPQEKIDKIKEQLSGLINT